MGNIRKKVPENMFGRRLLSIIPSSITLSKLYDITKHKSTYDDGYKKRYLYKNLYGKELTLPAVEVQNICEFFKVSSDYLFGYSESKEQSISDITGLSEKALERLEYLKQKNNGINQERLNAISMLFEECPDFPYICLDFYSLCLNMAKERKNGQYIHGLTNDEDIALSAYMQNENLRLMREKLIEKMKNEKSDYYLERVYLPVFSSKAAELEYYSKHNAKG